MSESSLFSMQGPEPGALSADLREARAFPLDLMVLRSMAKKLSVTLRTLECTADPNLPVSYSFEERRGRTHRMIIYAPHELRAAGQVRFVGFVSRRSQTVEARTIEEILRVDQQMLNETARIPGLLSYSSLELRPGHWYNLVTFGDANVKQHIRGTEVHRYAAHQLSPAYYAWIRLHNGVMPGGLGRLEFCLQSTRFYRFAGAQQFPSVHELTYEECTGI